MQPALSQMLEEDPGSLTRKKDLQEELSVIELQISNTDQGGKVRVLQSRETDAAVAVDVQAQGSSSSSVNIISKYHGEKFSNLYIRVLHINLQRT